MCDHSMWALYMWPLYAHSIYEHSMCDHSMWALYVWPLYGSTLCVTTGSTLFPKIHRKSHTCVAFQDPCFPCCPCFLVGCRLLFYQVIFVALFPSLRHPGVPEFHSFVDSRDSFGTNVLGVINAMLFILPKTQILWAFHPKNAQRNDLVTLFAPLHSCAWGVCRTKFPETVTQRPLRWKHANGIATSIVQICFFNPKQDFMIGDSLCVAISRNVKHVPLSFAFCRSCHIWTWSHHGSSEYLACQPFLAQQGQCAANDDTSSWWWY